MKRYFCDRCGDETERVAGLDYPDVSLHLKFQIKKIKKKFPITVNMNEIDVCDRCRDELVEIIDNWINE